MHFDAIAIPTLIRELGDVVGGALDHCHRAVGGAATDADVEAATIVTANTDHVADALGGVSVDQVHSVHQGGSYITDLESPLINICGGCMGS